jgi:cytochrome c oxidase assembly protein subunit 15
MPVLSPLGLGAASTARADSARIVATWLFVCCALVWAMVVVGGVTRLTHSGLSITEWQPIVGTLPPLNETQWQAAFARYQQTPEFQQINRGMGLAECQWIF